MKVHQKYSPTNDTPQSAEDICRDLVLEIVGKVVAPVEETSGIKRKPVEVECETQTTIDEKALEISALKINKEYEEKIELGNALYKILNKGVVQEESFPPGGQDFDICLFTNSSFSMENIFQRSLANSFTSGVLLLNTITIFGTLIISSLLSYFAANTFPSFKSSMKL